MDMKKGHVVLFIIFVMILGMFVYKDSLDGAFIWDDNAFIKENSYIRHWSYLPKIFSQPIGSGAGIESQFYRPVQAASYVFDYALWGLNQRGYHYTNILLHIVVSLMLFWFVVILFKNHRIAALTSILFLVHPVHTEAVCYLSGRGDPLSLLFMLLSLICYIKYTDAQRIIFVVCSIVSFGISLLSKENSLMLPALLLLYHYTFRKKIRYEALIAIVVTMCIYLGLRLYLLRDVLSRMSILSNLIERVPGFFIALLQYVKLLIMPLHLHMEYGKLIFAFSDYRAIIGMLFFFLVVFFCIKKGKSHQLLLFSAGWFLITLMPVANLYPIAFYMAEHNLYFPSIGFFLLVASAISYVYRHFNVRLLVKIYVVCLIAFYSFVTVRQNAYWKDPITFYTRTLQYAPKSKRILLFLAKEYYDRNEIEKALGVYKRILHLYPHDKVVYCEIGIFYIMAKQYETAHQYLEKALAIDAQYLSAYNGLGFLFTEMGRYDQAIEAFNKCISIDAEFEKSYYNLGVVHSYKGEYEEALRFYQKALQLNPDYALARNGIAFLIKHKEEK